MSRKHPLRLTVVAALLALLAGSLARADEAEDQYAVAAGHYARQNWKLAVVEFEAFLQKYPQQSKADQATFFLAEALLQLGRTEEANARFGQYLQREPNGPLARQAMFRSAEAAYLSGRLEQAKPQFEQFLAKHPGDPLNAYTLNYLGQVALSGQDYHGAEKYFRQMLREFPRGRDQDESRYGLARALDKLGQAEEAEHLYAAVAAKSGSPLAENAQFYLGALQYAQGRFEDAITTFNGFRQTFASSPWRATAELGRGWALLKLGRPTEAIEVFRAIIGDPKVGMEARYWLGLAQKSLKDWNTAAKTLLEALAVDPRHKLAPSIRLQAGDALLHAGKTDEAGAQFDEVLRAAGREGELADDALRGMIQVALLKKDYATLDQHVVDFQTRFPSSPLRADVQRIQARSLVARKEYQRAAEILEGFVAADGKDQQSLEDRYLLSLSYEGLQRPEDGLKVLAPVLKGAEGPLLADAQLVQATQLVALKRYGEAIAPLEAFLATQPEGDDEVRALGHLSVCYARTNQMPKAKQVYGQLLKEYPRHELIIPITEQMAEAAYDAGETSWSSRLFNWLGRDAQTPGYDARGISGLAWSQYKSGKLEEAAATFGQLLQKDPDPQLGAEAAYMRGQILEKLGKADQALPMYDLVIDKYATSPQVPDALWASARLHDTMGQHQEASQQYQRLADNYRDFPQLDAALYKWAWSLSDLERLDESSAVFERLRKEFPKSHFWADATFRLAQRAFEAKDYGRARELIGVLLEGKPSATIRENTLYLLGQTAAAEGKWEEARQVFETLLADHPQSAMRWMAEYGIAESIFRQRDYATAAARLQRLVADTEDRHDPWLAVAHLRLAQALVIEKQWDEAHAAASRIGRRFPNFDEQYEADYVVGRCLANRADFDGARAAYRKVIQSPAGAKTETAAKAQFMIAETYFHQKNFANALREYARLEILYAYPTWQAAALLQAAKCHEQLGEWKEAVDQYTKLLNSYPQSEFSKEAADRLRAAKQRAPGSTS